VEKLYKDGSTVSKGSDGAIVQGPLYGDPILKGMMSQIKTAFSGSTSQVTSSYTNPASIGVKTGVDGNLAVDSAAFQAAWVSNPGAVKSIAGFTNLREIVGKDTASTADAPILQIQQRIETQNKLLSSQIENATQQLSRREEALRAQFSRMETVIAQLKAASGSLTGLA
jgi:flagellar capping protein FliD